MSKSETKFQPGDIVVVVKEPTSSYLAPKFGEQYTVYRYNLANPEKVYLNDINTMCSEDILELHPAVKSPLWKALS